jgi:hypothetical protein
MNVVDEKGHEFINYIDDSKSQYFSCIKCGLEKSRWGFYYYQNRQSKLPDKSLKNLTCDEIIIKKIIE